MQIKQKKLNIQKFAKIFHQLRLKKLSSVLMEDLQTKPPNNSGQIYRLEIKQKNARTKKRKVKTWSPEEDDQLVKLYDEYPKKWGIIASLMEDRNQNQCLHRYRRLSQLGAHKKIWTADEDHTILSLVKKVGKNWKLLAEIMGTKTGKQIRQRFINKLDPKIKNDEWTDQQDKLILKYYSEVGSRWSEISRKLPGRPENKIKNRFYSFIQKNYDIRYVCVDSNSIENQNFKSTVEGQGEQNHLQNSNIQQSISVLQPLLKLEHLEFQKEKPLRLKQLSLNYKNQPKESNSKPARRARSIPNHSRFIQQRNQENIYQENQRSCSPQKYIKKSGGGPVLKKQQQDLPSIKQLDDQFKIADQEAPQPLSRLQLPQIGNGSMYLGEQKDQIFGSNGQISHRFYIKSLIRVQEEFGQAQHKYRSIRDLVSNNEIQNHENELFYLSHN